MKLLLWLKKIPGLVWAGLALFGGGLLYGLRLMFRRERVRDIKRTAEKRRKDLRDAEASGNPDRLREELLKSLKERDR